MSYGSAFRRGGDIDAVVEHFVLWRPYGRGTNCSTDGKTIFSYRLPIAKWVGDVVLARTKKWGTKTTDKHIRGLSALRGRGLLIVWQDQIDEHGVGVAQAQARHRISVEATTPHWRCEKAGRCVEPVTDEEKCR